MSCELCADKWPHRAGERVRMPNGVVATVLGAEGNIREGALANGDDGKVYFVARIGSAGASLGGVPFCRGERTEVQA